MSLPITAYYGLANITPTTRGPAAHPQGMAIRPKKSACELLDDWCEIVLSGASLCAFTSTLWVNGPVVNSPTAVDIYMEGDPAHPDTTWPSVPDNVLMADNLAYIVSPPLSIAAVDADNVLLSWPTNTSGFVLQQTIGLNPANWSTVTNAPVLTNGIMQVVLPAGSGQDFYRLIGP